MVLAQMDLLHRDFVTSYVNGSCVFRFSCWHYVFSENRILFS